MELEQQATRHLKDVFWGIKMVINRISVVRFSADWGAEPPYQNGGDIDEKKSRVE